MKFKSLLTALLCAGAMSVTATAADATFVNLTPRPKSITQGAGTYTLPQGLSVSTNGLPTEMSAEVAKFVNAINIATPLQATAVADASANITVAKVDAVAPEGYNLTITPTGVAIEASTPCGLYFAFQTIKKILPANVMAGKKADGPYELPVATINDEPRFSYRGFMLDVCRHFFTVDEVKRMIDVMSYYKMNRFHWHLSEDQGWRMEVPKWPKLTTVGATAPNCRFTDYEAKTQYWINRPYGPYFYTIDEMKDVVAYAAERHIEIVPEIEFPGHACAAVAAYPELSCDPDGSHSVKTDGGVYSDVFNIASPLVMQFAKDVIDVLAEVFPGELIHTGGDECPTNAWQNNAECQAKVKEMGFTGSNADQKYRKLQNWFTHELAKYAATKGKRIGAWNESITAGGADINVMKETDATIFCWTGADNASTVGTNNGLRVVYTPITSSDGKQYNGVPTTNDKGSFYINRRQSPNDAPANGNTWDTVDKVYNTSPFSIGALNKHPELCIGVQGTFWTERVNEPAYLEWLALPRLIAIAEIGWTPKERKDFNDFIERVKADLPMLDMNGYKYSPYFLEDAIPPTPIPDTPDMEPLTDGQTYIFSNVTEGFEGINLADDADVTNLNVSDSPWGNCIWTVSDVTVNADKTHTFKLTNVATNRAIASADAFVNGSGRLIRMGSPAAAVKATPNPGAESFTLEIVSGAPFWPFLANSTINTNCVTSGILDSNDGDGQNFSRKMGADWKATPVQAVTYRCIDQTGAEIFNGVRAVPDGTEISALAPEIKNHTLKNVTVDGNVATCTYERTAVDVTFLSRLENGGLLELTNNTVALGQSIDIKVPAVGEFFTISSISTGDAPSISPTTDTTVEFVFTTDATCGVKAVGPAVSAIEPGQVYLIHDNNVSNGRDAYRYANSKKKVAGKKMVDGEDPSFVWTFEQRDGGSYAIKNIGSGLYVQNVRNNQQGSLSALPKDFTLTYAEPAWTIKNAANDQAWDGQDNLNMVGWTAPGHPHRICSFFVDPYFLVTVKMVDDKGATLVRDKTTWVKAGNAYTLEVPERTGYEISGVTGNEGLGAVKADTEVVITYVKEGSAISEVEAATSTNNAIFDLQGRLVARISSPGIYIVNGHKIIAR